MCPYERHGAAGRLPGLEAPLGYRIGVPHLFRNEATGSGHACHHFKIGQGIDSQHQIEMGSFARQQGPQTSHACAVERGTVFAFAVTIAVITPISDAVPRPTPVPSNGAPFSRSP